MPRGEQVTRHWRLLQTLQRRGVGLTLRELTEEFGVSERTIQRDFEMLQELGMPIEFEEDEVGRRHWRLPADMLQAPPLTLTLTEAISLHLAENLLTPLAGTHLSAGLRAVLDKIRSMVPAAALEYFRELDEWVHVRRVGLTDYAPHADTIALLSDAARTQRTANVAYQSLWRADDYETHFDPYGLVYFDGDLFVVGFSHRAAAMRVLKITRIRAATTTDATFTRPADFNLDDHFRSTFGIVRSGGVAQEVVVRFSGPAAALIEERQWHASQELHWPTPDDTLFEHAPEPDTVIAKFRLADFVELKRWLKGFGPHAEVLQPPALRSEMRSELRAAAERYA